MQYISVFIPSCTVLAELSVTEVANGVKKNYRTERAIT